LWNNNNFPLHHGVIVNNNHESIRIRNHPRYQELVSKQRNFVAILTAATLIPYFSFILVAAFSPHLLSLKLSPTSMISIGWPLGAAFIILAWLFTGLYILRSNGEFSQLNAELRESAQVNAALREGALA
jgi:uncharacterized membrane protein (DUF485 family)